MSEFSKFIAAADGAGDRPLETDLYVADPQGLEADNIAATGNLNIGMIVDYDARAEHRLSGGAAPATSFHSDGITPANETTYMPMASQQSYYTSAPTTDFEIPSEEQSYHAASDKNPSYQQNPSEGLNPAAQDTGTARYASALSVTQAPEPPTVINEGGGDTIVTTTYNYTDNSTTTNNYTYNDYSSHDHNIIDINIDLLNGHHGHGGGGSDDHGGILPVIINNVFDEITNITTVVDHTINNVTDTISNVTGVVGDTLSNITGAVGDTLSNVTGAVTHTVDNVVDGLLGNLGGGLPGLPGLPLVGDILPAVTDTVGGVVGGLGNALPHVVTDVSGIVGNTAHEIGQILADPTQALQSVSDIVGGTVDGVTHAVGDITGILPEPVAHIADGALDAVGGLLHDPAATIGGLLQDPTGAVGGLLGSIIPGGTIVGAVDGVAHGTIDNLPDSISNPVLGITDGILHTVVGGYVPGDNGTLGFADQAVQGVENILPDPLSSLVANIDTSVVHNIVGGFGDADSGALSSVTTPIFTDVGQLLGGAGSIDLGGFGDAINNAGNPTDGLAGVLATTQDVLGSLTGNLSPSLLSSEGSGSGLDGAPLPGALALAEPVVGLVGDLHLPDLSMPVPDITMPVESVISILPGDTGLPDLTQLAGGLTGADPQDNALTLLAMVDHAASAVTSPLADVGNLLGGGAHDAATHADAAASLPAPVIPPPVAHILSGLFHH